MTGSEAIGEELLERWSEPHRRYHDGDHLAEVLAVVDDLADLAEDSVAVQLAAVFHDAVYEPRSRPGESEAASAELAGSMLGATGTAAETVAEVQRLILLTHAFVVAPGDGNGAVMADADLSILGARRGRYERYCAAVREEYGHVPDAAWRRGRTAVLRRFADRPRIFVTDRAHRALDAEARTNLAWELALLNAPFPPDGPPSGPGAGRG